jgi:hypothetical protein
VNRDRPLAPGETKNSTREAQAETRAKSGPTRVLVQNGQDVTPKALPDLSWEEQIEEIRRLNARVLGLAANLIDAGKITTDARAALTDASLVAKQWQRVSEAEGDASGLSDDALAAIVGN